MPMFGSETTVSVQVVPAEVHAGEEVTCRVDLSEIDRRVRRARVEVGYYNAYPEAVNTAESERLHRVEEFSDWVPVQSAPLFGEPPSAGCQDIRLQVPQDAPSTIPGEVDWRIRAVVDRRRGRDAHSEAPLIVRGDWERLAHLAHNPAESSGDTPVTIDVATRQLRAGDTVAGTITVNPTEEIHIRSVRVQLASERGSDYVTETTRPATQSVAGEKILQPGHRLTAPFVLAVPAEATPTYEAQASSHHWYIEAVIDEPLIPDEVTRLEILVTP
jgi:hypothetical protein